MPRPLLHLLADHCTSLQPPSLPSSTSANPSRTEQQEGHTLSRRCPACDIAVAKQFTAFPGSGSGRLSQPCVHPHRLPGVLQCGTAFPSLPSALMLLPHCPPPPTMDNSFLWVQIRALSIWEVFLDCLAVSGTQPSSLFHQQTSGTTSKGLIPAALVPSRSLHVSLGCPCPLQHRGNRIKSSVKTC